MQIGEIISCNKEIELNVGRKTISLDHERSALVIL